MKWISVNDSLPEHCTPVLIYKDGGMAVNIYFEVSKMEADQNFSKFRAAYGISKPDVSYYFCSLENMGNFVVGVTHWMPLPPPPKEMLN